MFKLAVSVFSVTAMLSASLTPSPVPEPTTYLMMGAGLVGLAYAKKRFDQNKKK